MKKKKVSLKKRLPMEIVETLRKRGGAHSTKKGAKGYNRKNVKSIRARDNNYDSGSFL